MVRGVVVELLLLMLLFVIVMLFGFEAGFWLNDDDDNSDLIEARFAGRCCWSSIFFTLFRGLQFIGIY